MSTNEINIFELASRRKLQFETSKGNLKVEDLWDLPLQSAKNHPNLDDIAKSLHQKIKESDSISFVSSNPTADTVLQLQFDIVRHIINVKIAERDALSAARQRAEQRQKIDALIASKQEQELAGKSLEELQALRDNL